MLPLRHQIIPTLLLIAACGPVLVAQTPVFPDSLEIDALRLTTDRFQATHNAGLGLDYRLDDAGIFGLVRAHMTSSTTLAGEPLTREEVNLAADLGYRIDAPINPFLLFEGTMTGEVGEVGLIPGIDNTAATFLGVGGRAEDNAGNRLAVAVGGAYNRQLNTEDAGPGVFVDGSGRFNLDGTLLDGLGSVRWMSTAPRTNGILDLSIGLERSFEEGTWVSIRGGYSAYANDLYVKRREEDVRLFGGPTFDGLLQRRENRLDVAANLFYPISGSLALLGDLSLQNESTLRSETDDGLPTLPREIDPYAFDRRQSDAGGSISALYTGASIDASFRLSLRSGSQKNLVEPTDDVPQVELRRLQATNARNDYQTTTRSLDGSITWRPGHNDTVEFSGAIGLYRYDTPDTLNTFDKDEQTISAGVGWSRRFSRRMSFAVESQVYLTHLVYLFGESSGDNNWNRVIRLAPSVEYVYPDLLGNRLTAELVANYTDYDFESPDGEVRGRSFRELRLRDSLAVLLPSRYGIRLEIEGRIAERGAFDWELFAESLLDRTRTELLEIEIFRGRDSTSIFGVGGKATRFATFLVDPRGGLEPATERVSVGPTGRILADVGRSTRLEASGWYEFRFVDGDADENIPWLFLALVLRL